MNINIYQCCNHYFFDTVIEQFYTTITMGSSLLMVSDQLQIDIGIGIGDKNGIGL